MNNVRHAVPATLAGLLVAALPMAAQKPTDRIFAHPPLHRIVTAPDAGPTGYGPVRMLRAYNFGDVRDGGGGQTIAIVDAYDDPTAEADLSTFTTQFGLPACTTTNGCFELVYAGGTRPPADTSGWSNEVAIDTQWAHSIAPAAKIMLVEAQSNSFTDLYNAIDTAVSLGANIVSMSWGGGEYSTETQDDSHFNVPGVVFVNSSGDGGHSVQYPTASPFVVSVGGTSLTIDSNGNWVSETAWSGSGGGQSRYEAEPFYQLGVQSSGKRQVPDVAYDGDPNTGVPAYSSHACPACYRGWNQWGGTSIGCPQWAALFARVNSIRLIAGKTVLSEPQNFLYIIPAADFHDIVSGSNGGCGTPCNAGPGYDEVTGLGSPIADVLIAHIAREP
jgi:subtilase family serine protease